nr:HWE histidine kinase domain-containing protein [Microvirga antarctica]
MSAESRAHLGRETGPAPTYAELVAAIHPEDRDLHQKTVTEALATKGDLKIEVRVRWPDTSDHWLEITGRARQAADGQVTLAGVSQDVTERRQAGDRQGLLLHELNHRVKNTLATVQSVASLTRRSAEPGDPALWDAFMGRLQGLAVTNDLLTATNWTGAVLDDVLRSELDPYQDALGQRIRLRGPRVSLQPSAVLAFGLAIHELATNAAKYGSLSNASGRVNVTWAVTRGTAPPALLVEWIETGGPSVAPPQRQGFGTKLIKRGLAQQLGGELKLEFPPDGVRCVISFPLASVTVAAKADYETSRSGSS